jgi:hypothetical protein
MQAAEFSKQESLHAILHGTLTQKAELSVVPFISRTWYFQRTKQLEYISYNYFFICDDAS